MKNREEKKNRIWVPVVVGALVCSAAVGTGVALVHNQQRPKASTVATMSDAADFSGLTTEVAEVTTTEETTTEAALEVVSNESEKPEAVPATTEIGGGKKKAEETTEEQKPTTNGGASNSGSQKPSSGSKPSTTEAPKPSSNGNSSSGGSNSSGNSNTTPSTKPSTPATTEAPKPSTPSTTEATTTQHQHVYNVWHKTKDAWTETIVDTPEQTITHPAEYKTVPAVKCHGCNSIFTTADAYLAHPCGDAYGYTTTTAQQMTKDAWTETIPAKTHVVHHDEEGYWTCSCGARK